MPAILHGDAGSGAITGSICTRRCWRFSDEPLGPRNAPWIGDVLAKLLSFPAGRTDDIADAIGLLGRLLDKMFGATVPTVEEKTIDDYHTMQGFSYLDDGIEGEDNWRTI